MSDRTGSRAFPRRPAVAGPTIAGGVAAALLLGSAAHAAGPPDESVAGATQLEEVVVHARRREERLQDVPLAASVVSAAQLHDQAAVRFDDVGRDVPNVRMVSSPQSVSALDVTMRGQTVNRSAIVFDPAVGLYIDGVYVANGQGAMGTLLDVGNVEVVRGSQGTLFGRNNTGGAISLYSHRPELDRYSAEFTVGGGDYQSFLGRAIVNLPVADGFALRLAYQDDEHEGFGSSVGSGQSNLENQHRHQLRVGALWTPSTSTDVYFTYELFQADEAGAVLHPLAGPGGGTLVAQLGGLFSQFPVPGLPTVAFPSDPYQTDAGFPAFDRARTDAFMLTVNQRLAGDLAAKLILGFRHLDASTALDVDASTLPLADTTLFNSSNQKSAELQLSGNSLGQRLDWVGGLYWFRDNGGAPSIQAPASPDFLNAINLINPAVMQATGGQLDLTRLFTALPVYEQNAVMNRSEAAFVHGEYHVTRDWAVAAGVRRTDDLRELDENSFVDVPLFGQNCTILDLTAPPTFQIQGPCPAIHKSVGYGYWSWEASTHYRLADGVSAYARIGRSQRSGGWNAPLATIQDEPFRPEQLTDYELGIKNELFGGALLLNGDVFLGQYDDMQRLLARLNPDGTPVTLITNAGRARISGAELEAGWRIVERAALHATLGLTDARYQTFLYTPFPGGPVQDLSGNDFYQTPRWQASLAGTYLVPTPAGALKIYADYAWQDKIQFNVINDFNYQPAYGTANARVALESSAHSWELAVVGRNLGDRRYAYTGGTLGAPLAPTPTIAWQVPGERRTVAVEGTYRWSATR